MIKKSDCRTDIIVCYRIQILDISQKNITQNLLTYMHIVRISHAHINTTKYYHVFIMVWCYVSYMFYYFYTPLIQKGKITMCYCVAYMLYYVFLLIRLINIKR